MKKQERVLFIGRFQPFHLGHIDALAQVFAREERIIIGVGSAEDDYVAENPFTAGERFQMIEAALNELRVDGKNVSRERFAIVPLRNIHHYSLWVRHIETLLPPFGAVYTGSAIVTGLFKDDGGHPVKPLHFNKKLSATDVRRAMLAGKKWEHLVPASVAALIKKWKGIERLRSITKTK